MNKLEIAKTVVTLAVGAGTTKVAKQVIQNNTTREKLIDKITIPLASLAIGTMAAKATKEFAGAEFDRKVEWFTNALKEAKETAEQSAE